MKRVLLAGLAILVAWMLIDLLLHRLFLAPIYEASTSLWRPFDQMNVALIYAVTLALIGVFVGTYKLLVRPKSLARHRPRAGGLRWACSRCLSGIWHFHSYAYPTFVGMGMVRWRVVEGARCRRCRGSRDRRILRSCQRWAAHTAVWRTTPPSFGGRMRGDDEQSGHLFSFLSPSQRVPSDHPLRPIREMTDEALRRLSPRLRSMRR
jgi:hypothetical protein